MCQDLYLTGYRYHPYDYRDKLPCLQPLLPFFKKDFLEFLCLDWPLHSGPLGLRHRGLAIAAYLQEPFPCEFRCQQCPAFVFFSRFSHSSSKNPYRISGSTNIIYLHSCHSTCTLSKHTTCTMTRLLWPAFTGRAHHTPLQIMFKDLSKRRTEAGLHWLWPHWAGGCPRPLRSERLGLALCKLLCAARK